MRRVHPSLSNVLFVFVWTVAYQKKENLRKFKAHVKTREQMDIKDIVKDHVLPCLPAKSLTRFKLVSKDWKARISSPFLAHQQSYCFKHLSGFFQDLGGRIAFISLDSSAYGVPGLPVLGFLPEENVSIRSCCNGLLLCQGESSYYVCNPVNGEYHTLPPPTYYHRDFLKAVLIFEPSSLNFEPHYQVICAFSLFEGREEVMFEIYDSSTKDWTRKDWIDLYDLQLVDYTGCYMNGVAYWETSDGKLLAFDVKNEIYSIIPLPSERQLQGAVSQMDGELCYIEASYEEDQCIVDIYGDGLMSTLKRSVVIDDLPGEEGNGWQRSVRILHSCDDNANILPILKDGCLLMYNIDKRMVECSENTEDYFSTGKYFPYVNSLVSLVPE